MSVEPTPRVRETIRQEIGAYIESCKGRLPTKVYIEVHTDSGSYLEPLDTLIGKRPDLVGFYKWLGDGL